MQAGRLQSDACYKSARGADWRCLLRGNERRLLPSRASRVRVPSPAPHPQLSGLKALQKLLLGVPPGPTSTDLICMWDSVTFAAQLGSGVDGERRVNFIRASRLRQLLNGAYYGRLSGDMGRHRREAESHTGGPRFHLP